MNSTSIAPVSFPDLAASRRDWIDSVLHPWCQQANRKQLLQAEVEWLDIAGRVDVKATLWTWAWERFPVLAHPEMSGVNETHPVRVTLKDGTEAAGYPDSRQSERGVLVLVARDPVSGDSILHGPFSIDDVAGVELVEPLQSP